MRSHNASLQHNTHLFLHKKPDDDDDDDQCTGSKHVAA
jgi:hypothetical protein